MEKRWKNMGKMWNKWEKTDKQLEFGPEHLGKTWPDMLNPMVDHHFFIFK